MLKAILKKIEKISFLNYFIYSILTLFNPNMLAEIDAERNFNFELKTNRSFRDKKDDADFIKEWMSKAREESLGRIKELRKSLLKATILTLFVLISPPLVVYIYRYFFPFPLIPKNVILFVKIFSSFLIVFALFLQVGRPLHSIGGNTIPENLDVFLVKLLGAAGVWLILFTYFLERFDLFWRVS